MFRDLLVATTGGPGDHAAVAAACAMAQGRGGHVTVLVHERLADVSLVGLGAPGELPVEAHDEIAGLLSDSGRPVLAVPEGHAPSPFSRVLIAWRPGANATRAIHEALPLLARAAEVVVVCVDPAPAADGEAPGSDLVRHLARHEVNARVRVDAGLGEEPGAVLLRVARDSAADLLVMGGYGHSRWREWVFGGTTRHVLRHATLPVLMSH